MWVTLNKVAGRSVLGKKDDLSATAQGGGTARVKKFINVTTHVAEHFRQSGLVVFDTFAWS